MNLLKHLQLKFSFMSIFVVVFVTDFVIALVKRRTLFFSRCFPSLSYVKSSESFIPHHLSYALKVMLFFSVFAPWNETSSGKGPSLPLSYLKYMETQYLKSVYSSVLGNAQPSLRKPFRL